MKNLNYILFSLMTLVTILSCWEDTLTEELTNEIPSPRKSIETDLIIQVVGHDNTPISGATVYHEGGLLGEVDEDGFLFISKIVLSEQGDLVEVRAEGHMTGGRTVYPQLNREGFARVQLLPITSSASFETSIGGEVEWGDAGAKITFLPNAVVYEETGLEYDGGVTLSAHYINPVEGTSLDQMPGDLSGIDKSGQIVALSSISMIGAELYSDSGEKLNLKTGTTAQVSFPIDPSLVSTAPSEITLWYFDVDKKKWIEEGLAMRAGNVYIGEVSHFSFWNGTISRSRAVVFSISVRTSDGEPVQSQLIRMRTSNGISTVGRTGTEGFVSGLIPKSEILLMEFLDGCTDTDIAYAENIGPYEEDIDYGVLSFDPEGFILSKVIGTVTNCDGDPIRDASVLIRLSRGFETTRTDINGKFSYDAYSCGDPRSLVLSIQAIDRNIPNASTELEFTLNGTVVNVGNIEICDQVNFKYVSLELDDIDIKIVDSVGFYQGVFDLLTASNIGESTFPLPSHVIDIIGIDASLGAYTKTVSIDYKSYRTPRFIPQFQVKGDYLMDFNITEVPNGSGYFKGTFRGNVDLQENYPNTEIRNVNMSGEFVVWKD